MTQAIGFSQRIALPWLHRAAEMAVAGIPLGQATLSLTVILGNHLSQDSTARWGNRGKTVTILRRIWLVENPSTAVLRKAAMSHWPNANPDERLALHWGLASATYPFWATVADVIGRLLALNERVAPKQVQQRLRERLGARETVARAGRRVWSTMHDWGVLKPAPERGVSISSGRPRELSKALSIWLAETMVVASGEAQPLARFTALPALFPFALDLPANLKGRLTPGTEVFEDTGGAQFLRPKRIQLGHQ